MFDPQLAGGAASPAGAAVAAAPLSETFQLHSNTNATQIIYLDFDGHTTQGTDWNTLTSIPTIVTPPYSIDADGAFSDVELFMIQEIWARVAEDFRPFQVDVTTEDPGTNVIAANGIRIIIGGSTHDWFTPPSGPAGGVAFLSTFAGGADVGAFAFSQDAGGAVKFTAEVSSHEAGHTFGLFHDGQIVPGGDPIEYYAGHGLGLGFPTGWAPIMGNGYGQELTQWSKGEYPNATNTPVQDPPVLVNQDDLMIISSIVPYRNDDHGGSTSTATAMSFTGTTFFAEGIIEQNTDVDWFSFTIGIEEVVLNIEPFDAGPNLDILATLYSSSGTEIATSNPLNDLNATFSINTPDEILLLQPGTYYISIDGVGKGATSDPGYTDYASLGYYSISGSRKSHLETLVGVDFDIVGGSTPSNWTLYSGGGPQAVLSNLEDEQGDATPFDLAISTTGTSISSFASTPDTSTVPLHSQSLNALGGFIADGGVTWTFAWRDLDPFTVYEVYVFGHADSAATNVVEIIGDSQTIQFTQTLPFDEVVVNNEVGESDRQLVEFARIVRADSSGEITISVTNEVGAVAALAGLAIRPAALGEISGRKVNTGGSGLEGWRIFLDEPEPDFPQGNGVWDTNKSFHIPSVDVPQEILDPVGSVAQSVKSEVRVEGVAALQTIIDVDVAIYISHTYVADLHVNLVSPSGTRVKLFDHVGGLGDDFGNFDMGEPTVFDDEATRAITSITPSEAPFIGSFRPEELLSAFDGEDANGVWFLEITDEITGDTGALTGWSLTITGSELSMVTDATGNYAFENLPPGLYFVREVLQEDWVQVPPGFFHQISLTPGARRLGVNFVNQLGSSQPVPRDLFGQKWNDSNGDGENEGEIGVEGWIIYLDGNNNGVLDLNTPVTVESTDVPQTILDFSIVTSELEFSGLGTISDVDLTFSITHSFVGDLEGYLISPAGTRVQLFTDVGGQFNNFINTTFDDEAAESITDGAAPFTGSFRPEGLLSALDGENPNGIWRLEIHDTRQHDVGTLDSWSLTITGTERFTETDAEGNYMFEDLLPGLYIVREEERAGWEQTYPSASYWEVTIEDDDVTGINFGNREVSPALVGDFNGNGFVDAADYILWRMFSGSGPALPNDNDLGTPIGPDHYDLWSDNFGNTSPSGGDSGGAAPEAAESSSEVEVVEVAAATSSASTSAEPVESPAATAVQQASVQDTKSESVDSGTPTSAVQSMAVAPVFLPGSSTLNVSSQDDTIEIGSLSAVETSDAALVAWLASLAERVETSDEDDATGADIEEWSDESFDSLESIDSLFERLGAGVA